jgi:hypothetical protein
MRWLTREEAQERASRTRTAAQAIGFAADVAELSAEIPIPPERIGTDQGPPSPLNRWYGCILDRVFSVDAQADQRRDQTSVLIWTPFVEPHGIADDWSVLLELRTLPKSIHSSRPLFIDSRNQHPVCVVYRPNAQGRNSVLYQAASRDDARRLMDYLFRDVWNHSCFIGEPESPAGPPHCRSDQDTFGPDR